MISLNLIGTTVDEVSMFFLSCMKEGSKVITFETGEYGMILLHRLISDRVEQLGMSVQSSKLEESKIKKPQFVKYLMIGGYEITVNHNEELDKGEDRDEHTGYPIKASTLYLI